MLPLSSAAILEKNKLSSDSVWLILVELDYDENNIIRVCKNTEDVEWNGQTWISFPIEIEPKVDSSKGEIPSVQIRVSNVNKIMQSYAEQYNGSIGKKVILRLVNSKHLDATTPEIEETFTITQVDSDREWVYITLSLLNPFLVMFPRQKYVKNWCRWKFRDARCKYSGSADHCDHSYECCKKLGNEKNFGGFINIPLGGLYATK